MGLRGGMCERLKQAVLRTAVPEMVPRCSNPSTSAIKSQLQREFASWSRKKAKVPHYRDVLLGKPHHRNAPEGSVSILVALFL